MLGHVEQSKDGSNDGHLTIVQCHPYHQPALSDLYRTSVRIHPLLRYHQQIIIPIIAIANQHHAQSTAAQPEPHHAPHTFHVVGQSYHTCTSSWGHGFWLPQGLSRIWVSTLQHRSEYEPFCNMFLLLPYAFLNNSLYVYVSFCINTQAVVCISPVQKST